MEGKYTWHLSMGQLQHLPIHSCRWRLHRAEHPTACDYLQHRHHSHRQLTTRADRNARGRLGPSRRPGTGARRLDEGTYVALEEEARDRSSRGPGDWPTAVRVDVRAVSDAGANRSLSLGRPGLGLSHRATRRASRSTGTPQRPGLDPTASAAHRAVSPQGTASST